MGSTQILNRKRLFQYQRFFIIVLMFLLLCCSALQAMDAKDDTKTKIENQQHVLVIGKVSANPKKHYRYLKPIADYAAKQMSDLGITEAHVLMARDNAQMVRYLQQGKVDWVTETIFSAIYYKKYADARFLVKKWKKGVPEYHTVFFTRKDSDIKKLSDLKGKTVAFEDLGSSTAFYYPVSALIKNGLTLIELGSPMDDPPKNRVGYVFGEQEINISTWVYRKMVDAGTFNNLDWEKDDHVRTSFREEMRIFHDMPPLPRAIEVVREDLNPKIRKRLTEILLNAHMDTKAKKALWAYQRTEKFEKLDDQDLKTIDEITGLLQLVQAEIK